MKKQEESGKGTKMGTVEGLKQKTILRDLDDLVKNAHGDNGGLKIGHDISKGGGKNPR